MTYTKQDFFRPKSNYTGPHNPAAYQRAIERRKIQNAAMAQANRAEAAAVGWMTPARAELMEAIKQAAEKGNEFAQSLWHAQRKYGALTERQEAAAQRFRPEVANASRAAWLASQPTLVDASAFAPMVEIMTRAATRLKNPGFKFNLADGDRVIRVTICGARTNAPGAVQVKDADTGEYIGRIHTDGKWVAAREFRVDTGIQAALTAFAQNPAEVAAQYGRRTGNCCFCSKPLTDARSTAVGYGETCAGHYQLPWGAK